MSQVLANSFVWAAELAMVAIGLSLSYALLGFTNFAHVEFVTVGAYLGWALAGAQMPLGAAIFLSMVGTGILAIGLDWSVFRRIRGASPAGKMIASFGIGLALRQLVQLIFGAQAVTFQFEAQPIRPIFGAHLSNLEVGMICAAALSMGAFYGFLHGTKAGVALRAMANNHDLAEARGIPAARMITLMWFISGAYAALGGIMIGLETQLKPILGLSVLFPTFSAATVGGLGSPFGAVAGSFLLALAQNVALAADFGRLFHHGSWFLNTGYKDGVALAVLILALIVRPRGLLALRTAR
jgi:branched-subunit amino acid ABC-type transport system permease component